MSQNEDRRAELVAAAATGDLRPEEQAELDALAAADPSVAVEVAELRAVADRIGTLGGSLGAGGWTETDPAPAAATAAPPPRPAAAPPSLPASASRRPERRTRGAWVAAAALVVGGTLGAAGTLAVQAAGDGGADPAPSAAPTGPPGELGAVEPVTLDEDAGGAGEVEVALVAHTWGTEAVLDVVGLPVGERYDVVFLDGSGRAVGAGAFLGSEVPIHCSLNAAVLREDVRALQILEADGDVVRSAALPAVQG